MILVAGSILLIAGAALLWYMRPKDGRLNRLATTPVLEVIIPQAIVAMLATGLILTIFRV